MVWGHGSSSLSRDCNGKMVRFPSFNINTHVSARATWEAWTKFVTDLCYNSSSSPIFNLHLFSLDRIFLMMCKDRLKTQSKRGFTPLALIMPSLLIWYISAFRVLFAQPILSSSTSPPLLTPDITEQLDLNPTNQYSALSFDSAALVPSPINRNDLSVFGMADLTQTGQVKEVPEQVTTTTGQSDDIAQESNFLGQEVPEQVNSAVPGDGSANQSPPAQPASTTDLSSSVVQGSGSSEENTDEMTPVNDSSSSLAQGSQAKIRSCSPKQARSLGSRSEKRDPPRPQRNPATLRGQRPPKPPKLKLQPQEPPQQPSSPGGVQQQNQPDQLPSGTKEHEECVLVPSCDDVNGQVMRPYCCPYVQKIGYDDRFASTRAGCTDCSYSFLLFVHFV